jgi:uncharacterized protein with PQ loop repeat
MALEPLKIPQNIYIEDRIIGPITLRQIIVSGIGGGISYVIWGMFSAANGGATPLPLTILSAIPFVISLAIAFVKINDLSLIHIGLLILEGMNKPKVRTFSPRKGISIHIRTFTEAPKQRMGVSAEKQEGYRKLDDLTAILDNSPLRNAAGLPAREGEGEEELSVRDASDGTEPQVSIVSRLPVNRDRIKASPLAGQEAGTEPRASVSIFRDIAPK